MVLLVWQKPERLSTAYTLPLCGKIFVVENECSVYCGNKKRVRVGNVPQANSSATFIIKNVKYQYINIYQYIYIFFFFSPNISGSTNV